MFNFIRKLFKKTPTATELMSADLAELRKNFFKFQEDVRLAVRDFNNLMLLFRGFQDDLRNAEDRVRVLSKTDLAPVARRKRSSASGDATDGKPKRGRPRKNPVDSLPESTPGSPRG